MDMVRAVLYGTLYTVIGFGLAFLFMHFAASIMLGQSGVEFIKTVDSTRISLHETYMNSNPNGWATRLISDKVYYSLCYVIVLLIWWSNVSIQLNKESGG